MLWRRTVTLLSISQLKKDRKRLLLFYWIRERNWRRRPRFVSLSFTHSFIRLLCWPFCWSSLLISLFLPTPSSFYVCPHFRLFFSWKQQKGFTPLHLAAKYGNIKVARLLLAKEAPVDAQGKVIAKHLEDNKNEDEEEWQTVSSSSLGLLPVFFYFLRYALFHRTLFYFFLPIFITVPVDQVMPVFSSLSIFHFFTEYERTSYFSFFFFSYHMTIMLSFTVSFIFSFSLLSLLNQFLIWLPSIQFNRSRHETWTKKKFNLILSSIIFFEPKIKVHRVLHFTPFSCLCVSFLSLFFGKFSILFPFPLLPVSFFRPWHSIHNLSDDSHSF